MNSKEFKTPGQYLKALIEARGWTQRTLSVILGLDETLLNKIANDNRGIDAKTALLLGEVFEVEAEGFLHLQKEYDLAKAKIAMLPDAGRAKRAKIYGGLPISEMIARGWIAADNMRNTTQVEEALVKFFRSDSIDNIEILPHAARKTATLEPATAVQIAWLYRVREIAEEMIVGKFSVQSVYNAVEKMKDLLHSAEEVRKIPRILAEAGIRFLLVEALPSSKIDGACLWIDGKYPVVAMSLRYDRIDNFWFVLRHELEHVIQKHGIDKVIIDAELEGEKASNSININQEERIANIASVNFCIPQAKFASFIARKGPFFKESDILGFSNTNHVHPGIVAGQLQHKTGRYDRFRKYLVKIRHIISSSAMVDGWGDIAPVDD